MNDIVVKKPKPDTKHKEYKANVESWTLLRDCYAGAKVIKERASLYLPIPNSQDKSKENVEKYADYLKRAMFMNVIAPTVTAIQGSIFRRDPKVKLPDVLSYLLDDVTGESSSLQQFSKNIVVEGTLVARYGILVDQEDTGDIQTKAEEKLAGALPRLVGYAAENIINWREKKINGKVKTTLVVLAEEREIPDNSDIFEAECETVYRVLQLFDDSYYVQTLWNEKEQIAFPNGEMMVVPTKKGGQLFDYIPFVVIGAETNSNCVDKSPLLPLAELNIGHYRNSADLEEACFIVGQPTFISTGLTQEWVDNNLKEGIILGSGRSIPLPVGADGKLLETSPNNLVAQEMKNKEERMLKLGLRSTDGAKGRETAQAARMREDADTSVMVKLSINVSEGLTKALCYAHDYNTGQMPADDEVSFKLNKIFYSATVDSQSMMQLMELHDKGLITFEELRVNLKDMGIIIDDNADVAELKRVYAQRLALEQAAAKAKSNTGSNNGSSNSSTSTN